MQEKVNTQPDNLTPDVEYSSEQEPVVSGDKLRDMLLRAPESKGNFIALPPDSVAIRLNADAFQETTLDRVSGTIDDIQRFGIKGRGYGTLQEGETLSSLNGAAYHDKIVGRTMANVTLLYGGDTAEGQANRIPSAVIVHEELSPEQLRHIRKMLPPDVPLLDGETNVLLDEVGAAEREASREENKIDFDLGHIAVDQYMHQYMRSWVNRVSRGQSYSEQYGYGQPGGGYTAGGFNVDDYVSSPLYGKGAFDSSGFRTEEQPQHTESASAADTPEQSIPQSEEVQAYEEGLRAYKEQAEAAHRERNQEAEKVRAFVNQEAQEKFGRGLDELDTSERKALYHEGVKKYHPDLGAREETADRTKYDMYDQVLRQNEPK